MSSVSPIPLDGNADRFFRAGGRRLAWRSSVRELTAMAGRECKWASLSAGSAECLLERGHYGLERPSCTANSRAGTFWGSSSSARRI